MICIEPAYLIGAGIFIMIIGHIIFGSIEILIRDSKQRGKKK